MMTSMMSRLVACAALAGLVGCEAGAPPGNTNDMHRLNIGGGQVDQSDGKTFVAAEVTEALSSGSIDQIFSEEESWEAKDCTKKELVQFIEQLNSSQFKQVERFFETMPKLSHTLIVTNPNTGNENSVVLEGLAAFFS